MDCSLPGFSVHGISQARILEWVAISSSRGCFLNPGIKPRSLALQAVSCIAGGFFPTEQLREPITVCQSVSQFSRSVMSNSLRPYEPQHARPPVHHQLPESTQTHVHWDGHAIQPSHPLSSPSHALNLSQYQGLFRWVSSLHQVDKVLEFQLQHQSFQWTPSTDLF